MRYTVLIGLLIGCDGGVDPMESTPTGEPTMTDTGSKPTTPAKEVPCEGNEPAAGLITDTAGAPVVGAQIRFCQGKFCQTSDSRSDGSWCAVSADAGWHSMEVRPDESTGLAIGYVAVEFADGETRVLNMALPPLGTPAPLPALPAELDLGGGIYVTAGIDSLETPVFHDDATEMSGARLELDDPGFPAIDVPGVPVALWFLAPFEYHADPGLPVRFQLDSVKDGTTLEVWAGSYDAQRWLLAGTVTKNGEWLEGEAALPVTSSVLLIQP